MSSAIRASPSRGSCPSHSVSELRSRPRNRHASDYPCATSLAVLRKRTARPLVTIHSDLRTNNFSKLFRYLRADNQSSFAGHKELLLVTLDVLEITLVLLSGVPRFERADLPGEIRAGESFSASRVSVLATQ